MMDTRLPDNINDLEGADVTNMDLVPRRILYYPSEVLLGHAEEMTKEELTDEFRESLRELFTAMYKENGMGLAAPQVGIPKRFFILNIDPDLDQNEENEFVFINPEILEKEGSATATESCLSCPGIEATITRAETVRVKALDENGNEFEKTLTGYAARAIQHEIEHLNGKLVVNHLTPAERAFQKTALNRLDQYKKMMDYHASQTTPANPVQEKRKKRKKPKKH